MSTISPPLGLWPLNLRPIDRQRRQKTELLLSIRHLNQVTLAEVSRERREKSGISSYDSTPLTMVCTPNKSQRVSESLFISSWPQNIRAQVDTKTVEPFAFHCSHIDLFPLCQLLRLKTTASNGTRRSECHYVIVAAVAMVAVTAVTALALPFRLCGNPTCTYFSGTGRLSRLAATQENRRNKDNAPFASVEPTESFFLYINPPSSLSRVASLTKG